MDNSSPQIITSSSPQCQYFVVRKKRLCRMTVKPGRQYCGEHEPQPKTNEGKDDTRIPCPNDPKHTCYKSKLKKHLSICNARQQEQPDYIIPNINVSEDTSELPRSPLSKTPLKRIIEVIGKVNLLYDKHINGNIIMVPEKAIHSAIINEFNEAGRTESSLRHLRQASSLLHIVESEQLTKPNTCYVELGAGKGQLSYYAWWAWCQNNKSKVLLVDRASLRHKRDNKLRNNLADQDNLSINDSRDSSDVCRIRADLADLVLERVPAVQTSESVVGFAKHLCGVATERLVADWALRCCAAAGARGAALATCCHHRCARGDTQRALAQLGIDEDDFDVLLGIVSWATCGDGRSRDRRARENDDKVLSDNNVIEEEIDRNNEVGAKKLNLSQEQREQIGKRAKLLIDWGRVLYLREHGFDARLVYYVPATVSLENVCIIAKKIEL